MNDDDVGWMSASIELCHKQHNNYKYFDLEITMNQNSFYINLFCHLYVIMVYVLNVIHAHIWYFNSSKRQDEESNVLFYLRATFLSKM